MNGVIRCAPEPADPEAEPIHAVEYVRMSTDNQRYSIENQIEVIRDFAERHHMAVTRSYVDYGKSGVTINRRTGFQALLNDVQARNREFSVVLVYDVSRWGRFQGIDESAYYEHICKRAGVKVIYCAEFFPNDGAAITALAKGLRRVMAAEYSRELSIKVCNGKRRLAELGFRQGSRPGFGFRRFMVSADGRPKGVLNPGERKSFVTDRVVLVRGPREEVEVIWRIFDLYVLDGLSLAAIARCLNQDTASNPEGRRWTRRTVWNIVSNRKYAGDSEFHKSSCSLGARRIECPKDQWIIREKAFPGLVTPELFDLAQKRRRRRTLRRSKEDLLQSLRDLLKKKGALSAALINKEPGMPGTRNYYHHFGGLSSAYAAIGYYKESTNSFIQLRESKPRVRKELLDQVIAYYARAGSPAIWDESSRMLKVGAALALSVFILRCFHPPSRSKPSWTVRVPRGAIGDFVLIARLAPGNQTILDLFLVPSERLRDMAGYASESAPRMMRYRLSGLEQIVERTPKLMTKEYQVAPEGFQLRMQLDHPSPASTPDKAASRC